MTATLEKRGFLLLALSLPLLIAPARFPELVFGSFDGIHPTNGVQPLWGVILTAIATVLHWFYPLASREHPLRFRRAGGRFDLPIPEVSVVG